MSTFDLWYKRKRPNPVPRKKGLVELSHKALGIIDEIQEIRTRNNKNWMDILRIAFQYAPDETKKKMADITECDAEINKLSRQLAEGEEK